MSKPAFDPTQPYDAAKPAFDPSQPFDEAMDASGRPRPETSAGEAALEGGAQGLTMGFKDEMAAGLGALYDKITGSPLDMSTSYSGWKSALQRKGDQLKEDHPIAYGAGNVAGSLATAAVPGLGALNASKGASLASIVGKGALQGGLTGLGESRAGNGKTMFSDADSLKGAAEDAGIGALVGGGTSAALYGLGKAASAAKDAVKPSRAASVLLGAPEEAVERYLKNPDAVNKAKPREELTMGLMDTINKLQDEVKGGSQASRKILEDEGKTVGGNQLADIFDGKADQILQRAEGTLDESQQATVNWLKKQAEMYRGKGQYEGAYSTNRVKDLLQGLDRKTQFESAPGRFNDVDDLVRADVRRSADSVLKDNSPAYTEQMKGVAKDSGLLSDVSDLAGTPQALDGLLKRVQRDRAFFPAEKLKALDERMGTNLMEDLKDTFAKEAFDKSATNGSRNVKLYTEMLGNMGKETNLPFGKQIGALTGATVDKYGPKIGKAMIDGTLAVQKKLQSSEGIQSLGKFAKPLMEAAKRGNNALAVTHLMLMKDPEYASQFEDQ